jgi:hypothetical protein
MYLCVFKKLILGFFSSEISFILVHKYLYIVNLKFSFHYLVLEELNNEFI